MGTIRSRVNAAGERRYQARVRLRGRSLSETFSSLKKARLWIEKTETDIRDGRLFGDRRRTVSDAIDAYLELELPDLAPSNRDRRRRHLEWWRERIGDERLVELTPAKIATCRNSIPASGPTRNRYLAALSIVLKLAVTELHWIGHNPALQVRRRPESPGRVRYLSPEERDRLLAACEASHDPRLLPLVSLALTTGARQGELLALRWSDLDLVDGLAIVQASKNKTRRSLVLVPRVVEILRRYGHVRQIDDRVFPGSFPKSAWLRALRGAEVKDFRFHDLRHTFASYLAMGGATQAEIATALGHKTLAMTWRYSHLSQSHAADVVRRIAPDLMG